VSSRVRGWIDIPNGARICKTPPVVAFLARVGANDLVESRLAVMPRLKGEGQWSLFAPRAQMMPLAGVVRVVMPGQAM